MANALPRDAHRKIAPGGHQIPFGYQLLAGGDDLLFISIVGGHASSPLLSVLA